MTMQTAVFLGMGLVVIVWRCHTYPRAQAIEKGRINKNPRVPLNAFQHQIKVALTLV